MAIGLAMLSGLPAAALAAGYGLRIEAGNAGVAGTAGIPLALYGTAPARCLPTLHRAVLDGVDLSIELDAARTGCDARRMSPFGLRVDTAAAAGVPLLPGQVYRVRVYLDEGGIASLIAFRLLDTSANASAPVPENGFWWSETSPDMGAAAAGTGVSIEVQDGRLALGLFGFGDDGHPTWSFGSARMSGRSARIDLVALEHGDPPFAPIGAKPSAEPAPRLEIEFLSPTRARAWLVRSIDGHDSEVRAFTFGRSRFAAGPAADAWTGTWVLVPDDAGEPRRFEFADAGAQDGDTIHLTDATRGASLDCRLAPGTAHADFCTLSQGNAPLADFDQVGLDRLDGRAADGNGRVRLLRVTR